MDLAHPAGPDPVEQAVSSEPLGFVHGFGLWAALAAALSILAAPAAQAQTATRILLVRSGEGVDAAAVRDVASGVRSQWRARGARVDAPPEIIAAASPPAPRVRLEAIWEQYHSLRLELAGDLAHALTSEAARTFGEGLDEDGQVELWLLTALIEDALGAPEEGIAALRRALAIRPELGVDPERYPPTLVERVEALRHDPSPQVEVRVTVVPEEAVVVVDGRSRGPGSQTLVLAAGHHWIRAEAPFRVAAGTEIEVGSGPADVRLGLAIDPARALAALGPPGAPLPARVREAIAVLDATACLLDVSRADAYELWLADDASGRRAELTVSRLDVERDVTRLLDALLEEGGDDSAWPWIVAGAAALLVAGAVVAGVVVANESEGWRAIGTR